MSIQSHGKLMASPGPSPQSREKLMTSPGPSPQLREKLMKVPVQVQVTQVTWANILTKYLYSICKLYIMVECVVVYLIFNLMKYFVILLYISMETF